MDLVTRKDLEQRGKYDYTWKASPGDNPNITGKVDSSRVSKKEGYEVVDLINALAKKWELKQASSAQKLEDMIHACDEVMRDKICSWISSNWKAWQT